MTQGKALLILRSRSNSKFTSFPHGYSMTFCHTKMLLHRCVAYDPGTTPINFEVKSKGQI